METKEIVEKVEKMEAKDIALALSKESSIFLNVAKFEHCQRVAFMLAKANMWPDSLKSIGDVMITLNLADRLQLDPLMLAQNISIIHGKPGFESKLVIALINKGGRFDPIEYEEMGNLKTPQNDNDGCVAYAKEIKSGKVLRGPKIDWNMVKTEGWYNKPGSKWKTGLAPLMFRYRAASYFAKTFCPEVMLGLQTKEELQDINVIDVTPPKEESKITEKPTTKQVDKTIYEPIDQTGLSTETPSKGEPRQQIEEQHNNLLITAFKNKQEKGLLIFEKDHRKEIMSWPNDVVNVWCDKFERTIGENYSDWVRKQNADELKSKSLNMVMCPVTEEVKTAEACEKECPDPDVRDKKECLARWSD